MTFSRIFISLFDIFVKINDYLDYLIWITDKNPSVIIAPIFAFVGLIIFIINLVIARIFLKKNTKSPSDYLIITGLLGDSAYGLMLFTFPFSYVIVEAVSKKLGLYFSINLAIFFYIILDCVLVLFSLLIIFFMTINRYFAIVKPMKYKMFFSKSSVKKIIFFINSICSLALFYGLVIFIGDIARQQYHFYGDSSEILRTFSHLLWNLPFYWSEIQLVLVVIDSSLMIFVYVSIARAYNLSCTNLCHCVKERRTSTSVKRSLAFRIRQRTKQPNPKIEYYYTACINFSKKCKKILN